MNSLKLSTEFARNLWIRKQGLAEDAHFGHGKKGALNALKRIGYVQIDTIFVIERAHHHILWSRVPDYRPDILHELQSKDKSVFEYWTHALSFIPTDDFRHYVRSMNEHEKNPSQCFSEVTPKQKNTLLRRIEKEGALSIRQIEEAKKAKDHEWASTKPSKRALEHLFYSGRLVVSRREDMLKHYELIERHFNWSGRPAASSLGEEAAYRLDRALDSQGVITLESATYLERSSKAGVAKEIELRLKRKELLSVHVPDLSKEGFIRPSDLPEKADQDAIHPERISILSPFDPLVIQRKRTRELFGFDYLIECYVPAEKRKFGYFSLPILEGTRLIARIDVKADRQTQKLLIQSWHWEKNGHAKAIDRRSARGRIEEKLEEFKTFQFTRREEYGPNRKRS